MADRHPLSFVLWPYHHAPRAPDTPCTVAAAGSSAYDNYSRGDGYGYGYGAEEPYNPYQTSSASYGSSKYVSASARAVAATANIGNTGRYGAYDGGNGGSRAAAAAAAISGGGNGVHMSVSDMGGSSRLLQPGSAIPPNRSLVAGYAAAPYANAQNMPSAYDPRYDEPPASRAPPKAGGYAERAAAANGSSFAHGRSRAHERGGYATAPYANAENTPAAYRDDRHSPPQASSRTTVSDPRPKVGYGDNHSPRGGGGDAVRRGGYSTAPYANAENSPAYADDRYGAPAAAAAPSYPSPRGANPGNPAYGRSGPAPRAESPLPAPGSAERTDRLARLKALTLQRKNTPSAGGSDEGGYVPSAAQRGGAPSRGTPRAAAARPAGNTVLTGASLHT